MKILLGREMPSYVPAGYAPKIEVLKNIRGLARGRAMAEGTTLEPFYPNLNIRVISLLVARLVVAVFPNSIPSDHLSCIPCKSRIGLSAGTVIARPPSPIQ